MAVRARTAGRASRKGKEMDQERNLESTDDSGPRMGQGSWLPPSAPRQPNTLREIEKPRRRQTEGEGKEEGEEGEKETGAGGGG